MAVLSEEQLRRLETDVKYHLNLGLEEEVARVQASNKASGVLIMIWRYYDESSAKLRGGRTSWSAEAWVGDNIVRQQKPAELVALFVRKLRKRVREYDERPLESA